MEITPELVLKAYASGVFPMAKSRSDQDVYWVQPDERGILPLDEFHVSRSLKKLLKKGVFDIRVNTAFDDVLDGCAEAAEGRSDTWINEKIVDLFTRLHAAGLAHSVECWRHDKLVGGLYGLAMGSAFFGESMFSRESNASKVALCHLVGILKSGGYTLLDTQFITDHLARFGAVTVPQDEYLGILGEALGRFARFGAPLSYESLSKELFWQSNSHTS